MFRESLAEHLSCVPMLGTQGKSSDQIRRLFVSKKNPEIRENENHICMTCGFSFLKVLL